MLQEETQPVVSPEYQRLQQEGCCQPKLADSLMGFDWACFAPRTFPEHAEDHRFRNPPEFLSLACTMLDAYVTAMFATSLKLGDYGLLCFCCRLTREKLNPRLQLEFVTVAERKKIFLRNAMIELLSSLPQLLRMNHIEEECCYLQGPGARVIIPYPGKLVPERSPYLRDRPCNQWPEVSLSIRPTKELAGRARSMVDFLWDKRKLRGTPN
jgi:hypothetical protein